MTNDTTGKSFKDDNVEDCIKIFIHTCRLKQQFQDDIKMMNPLVQIVVVILQENATVIHLFHTSKNVTSDYLSTV